MERGLQSRTGLAGILEKEYKGLSWGEIIPRKTTDNILIFLI
tara:strand:+ start:2485 stop:2610 length:126 start_codon:yes stop_codon:yes gene_type:complete